MTEIVFETPDHSIFKNVLYVIEATDCERYYLWKENKSRKKKLRVKWEPVNNKIYTHTVGVLTAPNQNEHNINISFEFIFLDVYKVVFFHGSSRVVDNRVIRNWIMSQCPKGTPMCNAMNFDQCISYIHNLKRNPIDYCPYCASRNGQTFMYDQEILVGADNPVTLKASVPGWKCRDCDLIITGSEGEKIRDKIVKAYLKLIKKDGMND